MSIEIERKYIIEIPSTVVLRAQDEYSASDIVQIYLDSAVGITHRIRSRSADRRTSYTETVKTRIDGMSAYEDEREISEAEFCALAEKIKQGTTPIIKKRHTFKYRGQLFEVDVYPHWKRSCILETELDSRDTAVVFPKFINVIEEVTGNKKYSNASMAMFFPREVVNEA